MAADEGGKVRPEEGIPLSAACRKVLALLADGGFTSYVVGGAVRDALLGRPIHDVDLTTEARPEQVSELARAAGYGIFETGIKHGTVTMVVDHEHFEVTTFRVDGTYSDNRHPDEVRFAATVEEDLARRDFTINAMAYAPEQGVVDPFHGQADLQAGLIRCVGTPEERFGEDALRVLRALRFSAQLGFELEEATAAAVHDCAGLLQNIARERIAAEFTQLICAEGAHDVLLEYTDVVGIIIPQLAPEFGLQQHNDHHVLDVWEHSVKACSLIPHEPVLRYAALLHDIGKPSTFSLDEEGVGHFYGHPQAGEPIAREVCHSLRLPNEMTDQICTMVLRHGDGFLPERRNVRRWMRKLGPDMVRDILLLKRADVGAMNPKYVDVLPIFDEIEKVLDQLLEEEACFRLSDLAINGRDLIDEGIAEGPLIGRVLTALLDKVVDEELPNEREALLQEARRLSEREL